MRRSPTWLIRFAREDDGLTAIEYAVLVGLVIAIGGAAAFWLGRGVNRSNGHVAWAGGSSSTAHVGHSPASLQTRIAATASTASRGSVWPWVLLSLAATVGCVGGFVGWHYLRDVFRQRETRRRVRRSLSDAGGQKSMERLVRQTSRGPIVRSKKLDTHLIGRHGPDLHRLLRERESITTAPAANAATSSRPAPVPPPTVPVAG